MKNKSGKRKNTVGLTLIEILTVVAIIAILAAILLPVLARQKVRAKANLARLDCSSIAQAITQYNMDNIGRYPIANDPVRYAEGLTDGNDITFSMHNNIVGEDGEHSGDTPHNADLMIILSAIEGMGVNNVNAGHSRNSKKTNFLGAKFSDTKLNGLGPDGIFRDPFGNAYVVTIDKNGDDKCWDMFYGKKEVSGPTEQIVANGLMRQEHVNPDIGHGYVLSGKAMVWSAGPDKLASDQHKATGEFEQDGFKGTNNDNIIGW